jgi:Ni/Co efflux regulator RcnB
MRFVLNLCLSLFLAVSVAATVLAQPRESANNPASVQKAPKLDRVSGTILRWDKDKSMLTVTEDRSKIERTVYYSASTKWTRGKSSAEMKDFKNGARVICVGTFTVKHDLSASRIDLQ